MIFYLEKLTVLLALFFLWRQLRPASWWMLALLAVFFAIEAYFAINYLLAATLPPVPS